MDSNDESVCPIRGQIRALQPRWPCLSALALFDGHIENPWRPLSMIVSFARDARFLLQATADPVKEVRRQVGWLPS